MLRLSTTLARSLVILAVIAVTNQTSVQGQSQGAGPKPVVVTDVNSPAHQPFQTFMNLASVNSFVVPDGKRLVIEFVSADLFTSTDCYLTSVLLSTTIGEAPEGSANHYFVATQTPATAVNSYGISQQTRIYADPGTIVGVGTFLGGANCNVTSAFGGFTVSGHLVDLVQ